MGDAVRAGEVLRPHFIAHVVVLPLAVGAAKEDASADDIAAVFRDHVRAQAAGLDFSRVRAGAHRDLGAERVVDVALLIRGLLAVHAHAIDVLNSVFGRDAVAPRVGLLHLARSADIRRSQPDTGHHHADRHDVARGRQGVDQIARQDLRAGGLGDVDQRRLTRYGNRFSSAPTLRSALAVTATPPGTSNPSRTTVLNPVSEKLTR